MYRVRALLGIAIFALVAIGIVVLASASSVNGIKHGSSCYFLVRQLEWMAVAVVVMAAAAFFDYHKWREFPWLTVFGYLLVVGMLGAVFLYPPTKGSYRWLPLGASAHLQPSELAKLMVVFAMAVYLDRVGLRIERFSGAFWALAIVLPPFGLALAEPDFGAAMVIALGGGVLLLIGGMRWRHVVPVTLLAVAGVGTLLAFNSNRMYRMAGWLPPKVAEWLGMTPEAVSASLSKGSTYQFDMAQVAIGNGRLTGRGLNESLQKLTYLPEAHTDCVFAIGAEEWGLGFSLLLLFLYLAIFVLGIMIALKARDRLGRMIAYGMTMLVVFQALFNMGVVSGIFPPKGMALPFISYGGTNLIVTMAAMGTLFNIARQIGLPKVRPRSTMSPVFSKQGE
ncbi:MAG: FtsW/RodA/SpoVE family cell cycle protein [Kiritimatiellia bacterium]